LSYLGLRFMRITVRFRRRIIFTWLLGFCWWCVAGSLEGSPHVPAGYVGKGVSALAEGQEFFGFGHVFFAVGDDQPFFLPGRGWEASGGLN